MLRNIFKKVKHNSEIKTTSEHNNHIDYDDEDWKIINIVRPYTMTSSERIKALLDAVKYIIKNRIDGDMVECGTWKGGSVMAMQMQLLQLQITDRKFHIFDTFQGMSAPIEIDKMYNDDSAKELLEKSDKNTSSIWAYSPMEEVIQNLSGTGYPMHSMNLVKGMVEDTIPIAEIEKISILRLDTDWYESTKIELEYLYPKLAIGGILIIDDYGHWKGCKKAVDEYFSNIGTPIFFNRIDYTGRLAVKLQHV